MWQQIKIQQTLAASKWPQLSVKVRARITIFSSFFLASSISQLVSKSQKDHQALTCLAAAWLTVVSSDCLLVCLPVCLPAAIESPLSTSGCGCVATTWKIMKMQLIFPTISFTAFDDDYCGCLCCHCCSCFTRCSASESNVCFGVADVDVNVIAVWYAFFLPNLCCHHFCVCWKTAGGLVAAVSIFLIFMGCNIMTGCRNIFSAPSTFFSFNACSLLL